MLYLERLRMDRLQDQHLQEDISKSPSLEADLFAQLPSTPFPGLSSDQVLSDEAKGQPRGAGDLTPSAALPTLRTESLKDPATTSPPASLAAAKGIVAPLRDLIKSSGLYVIGSMAPPLASLVLAPFLTHTLSPFDYGILTILNTLISLGAGITQLGLGSAFFRAYGYDYTSGDDRRHVLGTVTTLLCLVSLPVALGTAMMAPFVAHFLFGQSSLGGLVVLATGVILVRNLSIPGFAWLRAESRAFFFSLLSIGNLLIAVIANLVLVGVLRLGLAGSLLATACGYVSVIIVMMPIIVLRASFKIRIDIARSLLAFGTPLIFNVIAAWVLDLADRYLLGILGSFSETARYAVAYTLGSALSIVIIGPFTLAWPTAMFAIAQREDAPQIFKLMFRWFGMFLLFAAFGLSLAGTLLLDWLFPLSYHTAAFVIPIVAVSLAFYGVFYVFGTGESITRKTWWTPIFLGVAALVNVALNLVLIPRYGAMGAALATLIAYVALAFMSYLVNQRLYPIPFEIHLFLIALVIGCVLYIGSDVLGRGFGPYGAWTISFCAFMLYGGCLVLLGRLMPQRH